VAPIAAAINSRPRYVSCSPVGAGTTEKRHRIRRGLARAEAPGLPAGDVAISQGDAFDAVAGLAAQSVDLICTSPPYWGHRTYGQRHNDEILEQWKAEDRSGHFPPYEWYRDNGGVLGLEPYPEWYVSHLVEFFSLARPALKPGGNLWVNLGDTYFGRWSSIRPEGRQGLSGEARQRRKTPSGGWLHDKQLLLLPARFAIGMQEQKWIVRNDVIWAKPTVPPRPEKDRLRLSHEHFFHFVQRTRGGRPSYYYDLDGAEDGALDVVSVPSEKSKVAHPAMYPPDLIRGRILTSSPPEGLVVDPFCGSGTTLTTARELGRSVLGFDISETYVEIAREALNMVETSVQ
jgi:site-specific DNA-methyltransferase (cytosine-N4-specific)